MEFAGWRMASLGLALVLSGCLQGTAPSATQGAAVREPTQFIANSLGPACAVDNQGRGPSAGRARMALAQLDANHQRYIDALNRSTSLTSNKDQYEQNWKDVLSNSYAAAATGNAALARTVIDGLKVLAANNRYNSEPGLATMAEAQRNQGGCYRDGPGSPCLTHTPRSVARMHANLLIAAVLVEPWMTPADRAVLDPWFAMGQRRFVGPQSQQDQSGLYDLGNLGMGRLAYAAWTDDMGLASRDIALRRRQILRHIEPSGYIDENSFRGVRGFWYHTYGLDPFLSYALLSRAWGADLLADPAVQARFRAAVDKTRLGITDPASFRSVGNRGDAYSTDPADTRDFVHQFALNLYPISAREFGVALPRSPRHDELKRYESFTVTSGFLARCYYDSR